MDIRPLKILLSTLLLVFIQVSVAIADQPVMNEVPRWAGGYGGQIFQEFRFSDDIFSDTNKESNPNNQRSFKHITHIEGVYTFKRWIRTTIKIPLVRQSREVLDGASVMQHQQAHGLDDIKLALPIRKYFNGDGFSGHVGIVPQIRFWGDDKGDFKISDGSTDPGFSLSSEYESVMWVVGLGLTKWWEQRGEDQYSADLTLGWNFHDQGSFRWETEYEHHLHESIWLATGPTLFWNFNDFYLGRVEYKQPIYQRREQLGLGKGRTLRIGLGIIF